MPAHSPTQAALAAALLLSVLPLPPLHAQPFHFPTANRALLEPGGEERFFVGTVGRPWTSGTFGCVRTEGRQLHEGLDIRNLQRDRRGEPTDPVLATAPGVVAYINDQPGLSTYGIYVILRHRLEGLELYSLYAHLSALRPGLRLGQLVPANEPIGTVGRTANTRQSISKERAHLHFEINFMLNDRFAAWHQARLPGQRNDHGDYNGRNFLGLDPAALLRSQHAQGTNFSLVRFIQSQPDLCRIAVRAKDFPWLKRCSPLIARNPVADREGIAGYELTLNFMGIPCRLTPRAPSELPHPARVAILHVNPNTHQAHPCRRLLVQRQNRWELTAAGEQLLDLLLF